MKANEFKVGSWYKMELDGNAWYICFKEILEGRKLYSNSFINKGQFNKNGYFGNHEDYNWAPLLDLSEIVEFLPTGHPDKNYSPNYEIY